VVQQNAAHAQESASASQGLTAEAEQMKSAVGELTRMIGGNSTPTSKTASEKKGWKATHKIRKSREEMRCKPLI